MTFAERAKLMDDVVRVNRTYNVIQDVSRELSRAVKLFPNTQASAHEGYAVLLEEMDELWDAIKLNPNTPGRSLKIQKEAVQVAAMAIRFLVELHEI